MRAKSIRPRKVDFKFSSEVPKHWMSGKPFLTHLLNSFTLVFPEGEKYFIRSIKKYLPRVKDPELQANIRGFMGQEFQHAVEHEKFLSNLRNQGYKIDHLLAVIAWVTRELLEPRLGSRLNLSTTAGLEHFTALLAEIGLGEGVLKLAHPEMRALFEWHAAEELEHKAIAFDMLQAVDDSYALRISGVMIAWAVLSSLSIFCTVDLLRQDRALLSPRVLTEAAQVLLTREALFFKSARIFFHYFRPGFHPEQWDNSDLAEAVFSQQGYSKRGFAVA